MSALTLELQPHRERLGLKGPRAAQWLAANGIDSPAAPNTWTNPPSADAAEVLLVARLGSAEFFLEEAASGTTLKRIAPSLEEHPPGVYPVLREDWGFVLGGEQPVGFIGIAGAQAGLLLGGEVFDEKAPAFSSEQSELGHGLSPVLIVIEAPQNPGASAPTGSENWLK